MSEERPASKLVSDEAAVNPMIISETVNGKETIIISLPLQSLALEAGPLGKVTLMGLCEEMKHIVMASYNNTVARHRRGSGVIKPGTPGFGVR